MAKEFLKRLLDEAKRLKAEAIKVRWQDVLAAVIGPQNDEERAEIEKAGTKSLAKWATKIAKPPSNQYTFDDWAEGSIQDPEGARIAIFNATLDEYDFQIKQLTKTIDGFTRTRDKVLQARAALIQHLKGKS